MATFNGTEGNDTLIGGSAADDLHGFGGNDFMQGGDGADTVLGDGGNDTMSGNGGNDWVRGGTGNDQVSGGGGQDSFAFHDFGATNADVLTDFSGGWDNIHLDVSAFSALGSTGRFASGDARFRLGASAQDADDRIIYNQATGQLWYDADGNGAGAAQLIATLSNRSAMSATDIHVFQSATPPPPPPNEINGTEGDDTLVGTPASDTMNGLGGNDSIVGFESGDSMSGGAGNDTLDGLNSSFSGNDVDIDTMAGGFGNDYFMVDNPSDVIVDAGGIDTVAAHNMDFTLPTGFENLELWNGENEFNRTGTGNAADNTLDGSMGWHVTLFGMGGNDNVIGSVQDDALLSGGAGNDRVYGWQDHDVIEGNDGNDTLIGGMGDDTILGGAGNDSIWGHEENSGANELDLIDGGAGNDTIVPGIGVVRFSAAPSAANADLINGLFVGDGGTTFQIDGATHLNSGPSGRLTSDDPRYHAAAGATGGHDADDRIIYNTTTGQVYWDADGSGAGVAQPIFRLFTGGIAISPTQFAIINGQNGSTINGTAGNDSLVGTSGDDTINGFGGNDTIDGLAGVDSMVGGPGDDLYFVDEQSDIVVEGQNDGIDEVRSSALSYTLSDFVNNLTLIDQAELGTGNSIDNLIVGTERANVLSGGAGNDTLIGGGVISGEASDQFTGGAGNDSMVGGSAGNGFDAFHLLGDTTTSYGNDTIVGAGGEDWIFANGAATVGIVVNLAAGTLTGGYVGSSAVISGIENIWGTELADRITGDGAANRFDGNGGNDTLDGAGGNDRLSGGAGADTFILASAPGAANADTILGFQSGLDEIRLDATVMPALGASGDFTDNDVRFHAGTAAHDADDRIIFDSASGDIWYDADGFGAGAQQLIANLQTGAVIATDFAVDNGSGTPPPPPPPDGTNGTEGNDTMIGTAGSDTLNGLGGNDFMQGQGSADTMRGGAGNDTMGGNDGLDWIEGGAGNDRLTGGSGQDSFVFREFGAANADTLTDFAGNNWDNMRMDNAAFTALGGDGRFASGDARFRAGTAAQDADDRLVFNSATGQVWYDADGSGAGAAQLVATLQAGATLVASDIWVI